MKYELLPTQEAHQGFCSALEANMASGGVSTLERKVKNLGSVDCRALSTMARVLGSLKQHIRQHVASHSDRAHCESTFVHSSLRA